MHFFNYVMRKGQDLDVLLTSVPRLEVLLHVPESLLFLFFLPVWLHQTRIGLSLYDVAGQGYLRESVSISIKNHSNQRRNQLFELGNS